MKNDEAKKSKKPSALEPEPRFYSKAAAAR